MGNHGFLRAALILLYRRSCPDFYKCVLSVQMRRIWIVLYVSIKILRPRQHGRHFADDTFKRIFLNENIGISIKISLMFVHKGPINNIPALVQIMAWRWSGHKPLSETKMVRLPTNICVTRPQWVKVLLGSLLRSWRLVRATRADKCEGMEGCRIREQILTCLAIVKKQSWTVMISETRLKIVIDM